MNFILAGLTVLAGLDTLNVEMEEDVNAEETALMATILGVTPLPPRAELLTTGLHVPVCGDNT